MEAALEVLEEGILIVRDGHRILFANSRFVEGSSLLEQDIVGKVRFFGGNLKATNDFAKKAAHVAHENLFSPQHE